MGFIPNGMQTSVMADERVTVRVGEELRKQMKREDGVNWSEFIRNQIEERLSEADRRRIEKLVEGYRSEYDDLKRLWILHMFGLRIEKRQIYETSEYIFEEDVDDLVDEVERDLEDNHISKLYNKAPDGEKYGDIIVDVIEGKYGDLLRDEVKDRLDKVDQVILQGVSLLPYYIGDNLDADYARVNIDGFERTWGILCDEQIKADELLKTGIVYKDRYSSNAYSYNLFRIPAYALDMIRAIIDEDGAYGIHGPNPSKNKIRGIMETNEFSAFLSWMDGTNMYVNAYNEEEEIEGTLTENELELSIEDFKDLREKLIKGRILVLDYSPHRSSTGGRSSRPARWIYQITEPSLKILSENIIRQH
jgi:hypothetical protein